MRSGLALSLLLSLVVLLTGCSLTPTAAPVPENGAALQGVVHGGQQPVIGAHVYLFQANTFGYGENSLSLLDNKPGSTTLDTSGGATNGYYYVTTASDGTFSISGDYICNSGAQVYLYALGGNPGSGVNSAAGFLAALGTCPASDSFSTSTYVYMNEVTTIATAYALAGFATDAVHISSSGTALAQQGVANAFANINNLVSSSGTALATTPSGNGTVPQTTINTLANILAACINSTGATSSACSTLLSNTQSGGATGTTPTDTATVAINIAHHAATNVSTIFAIPTPTPPFAPALPSTPVPNDFSIGINFTGGGLNEPEHVAIDGSGNVWISNIGKAVLTEISSSGSFLSGTNGYSGADPFNFFFGIAIDASDNVWASNPIDNALVEFSSAGVASSFSPVTGDGLNSSTWIAVDGSGDPWVANGAGNSLSVFSSSGVPLAGTPYTGGGLNSPASIAFDNSGNAWTANCNSNTSTGSVSEFTNSGVSKAGANGYTSGFHCPGSIATDSTGNAWIADSGAGLIEMSPTGTLLSGAGYTGGCIGTSADSVAIDGAGNAWVIAPYCVAGISTTGASLTGTNGYKGGDTGLYGTTQIALDGSGDAWAANYATNTVTELIGIAAPVVTPLAAGAKNHTLGTRP